jgi:hypothetical protein
VLRDDVTIRTLKWYRLPDAPPELESNRKVPTPAFVYSRDPDVVSYACERLLKDTFPALGRLYIKGWDKDGVDYTEFSQKPK